MSSVHSSLSWRNANPDSPLSTVLLTCLAAFLCFVSATLAGSLSLRPQMVWPLWPGCALLVGLLLLAPRKLWPPLIAAGLGAFALYDLLSGLPLHSTALLVLADTVEVLIAALGVSYCFDGPPRLNSIKSLAAYSFFAVILAPLVSAFIATPAWDASYWIRWRIGFFTEALALLTLTPAVLSWVITRPEWMRKSRAFYFEAATLILGLSLLGYVAFVARTSNSLPIPLYSLLPFLLWSALRFGSMGVSTSMIVVAFFSIWGAVHGRGPFTGSDPLGNVISLQLFLFFAATTFMVLAVLVEEQKQTERAFRESENRFRLVADTAPVLIWMSETDKLCSYFNKPWLDFTGRSLDQELGNGWAEGVHPDDLRRCMDIYTQAFDRREAFSLEYRLRRHDGEHRWVLDIGVPRFNQERSFVGYIGTAVDVTEHKQAEEALRQSEGRFRLAAEAGKMFAYEWDATTDVIVRSEQSTQILGIDASAGATGQQILTKVHADDRERLLAAIGSLTADKPDLKISYRMVRPDNSVIWVERISRAHFDEQGKMLRIVGMVGDVTERKRAEEALSSMSRRLIEAQEQERTRIARELHDDMGQRLALVANELEQLQHSSPDLDVEIGRRIAELKKHTFQIATDIQSLSHKLHSSKLEYLGIAAAMRGFCQEFGGQQKVKVEFKSNDVPSRLSSDISLCLFRVLQEALHNSVKHSGAGQVEVRLWGTPDEIHLAISDSGAGFDREAAKESRGLGLISMEERLKLLQGTFSIETQPQRGTTIHARVPLNSGSDSMRLAG
jgi:PAS domain S-box-containing protein